MPIDRKTALRIAHLARLKIPPAEEQQVANELGKILDWVAQLDKVDTKNIEPLART